MLWITTGNQVIPPGPLHSSSTGGGSRVADQGDSDLSRVEGSNVVASVGQTQDRNGFILSASGSRLPWVS